MKESLKILSMLIAGALLAGCSEPKQGIQVNVDWDCDDSNCEVLVDIRNPSEDFFKVEYDFSALGSGSILLGELNESLEVRPNQNLNITHLVPVESKPRIFYSGSESLRL